MIENNLDFIFNFVGTGGVFCILIAYFLMQTGKINAESLKYSVINLLGAILIIVSLLRDWNLPSFIINFCWVLISLYGIYKCYKNKKRKN